MRKLYYAKIILYKILLADLSISIGYLSNITVARN
jgi:hypothetical protein